MNPDNYRDGKIATFAMAIHNVKGINIIEDFKRLTQHIATGSLPFFFNHFYHLRMHMTGSTQFSTK